MLQKGVNQIGVYGYTVENDEYTLVVSPKPVEIVVSEGSFTENEVAADNPTPTELEEHYLLIKELVDSGRMKGPKGDTGEDGFSPTASVSRTQADDGAEISITDKNGTTKAVVYDGQGGGGTSDYSQLTNKPSINSVELNGNKSLADLGIQPSGSYALSTDLTAETTARQNSDINLQGQIDAITAASDVVDIVGTYAELQQYDTSKLTADDIVKVLQDSTHSGATAYYRWTLIGSVNTWDYIGSEGPSYTKAETDVLLQAKQNTLTAGQNISISAQNVISNIAPELLKFVDTLPQTNIDEKAYYLTLAAKYYPTLDDFLTSSAISDYPLVCVTNSNGAWRCMRATSRDIFAHTGDNLPLSVDYIIYGITEDNEWEQIYSGTNTDWSTYMGIPNGNIYYANVSLRNAAHSTRYNINNNRTDKDGYLIDSSQANPYLWTVSQYVNGAWVERGVSDVEELFNKVNEKVLEDKVSSSSVATIWTGTQAEYDVITTKDSNTLYFIVEA